MLFAMLNLQSSILFHNPYNHLLWNHSVPVTRFGSYSHSIRAAERDSDFEFDPDKAREALRKLDQQFDLISQKQTKPVPKIKASSPNYARDEATKIPPDYSGSLLPVSAFALLFFTIVYNILFITVIKPSVDGPQVELSPTRSSIMTKVLKAELLPQGSSTFD